MSDEPSPAYLELRRYFEAHSNATRLLHVAAEDYAAARCLLLNGLFPGLTLGAQAIEKTLKSYLLLRDPKTDVKKLSHSLTKLLEDGSKRFPQLGLSQFAPLVAKFRQHYQMRYPDNSDGSTSVTTADLFKLDTFIVFLNENLPCPRNVKYRTRFYAAITFSLGYQATVTPTESWIKNNNRALAPLLSRIEADYALVVRELYP